jgi:type IV pilus assembly protein PilY1
VFVVSLDTGAVLAKLEYDAADTQLQHMTFALPTAPAVLDIDFDGFVDLIYFGDLGGQMWKWDLDRVATLTSGLVDNWPAGRFFVRPAAPLSGPDHYRSIFYPPVVSYINDEIRLAFATGERTDLDYLTDTETGVDDRNRFYVIDDPQPTDPSWTTGTPASIPSTPYTEADLTDITNKDSDDDASDQGYFFIAAAHEKFVTNHLAFAGFVVTASYIHNPTAPICDGGGSGAVHIFSLEDGGGIFNGGSPPPGAARKASLGGGVPSDPRIVTGTKADGSQSVKIMVQTSEGAVLSVDCDDCEDGSPVDQVFWRQEI